MPVPRGVYPAQAIHDVGVATFGQPRTLQELAVFGRNAPSLDLGLAARRQGGNALSQVGDVRDDAAIQPNHDVAEAQSRVSRRTSGHDVEQEGAVRVGEAKRECQRQLDPGSISTPNQPFWPSLGRLPSLTCTLSSRPWGWTDSLVRGAGAGVVCVAGIADQRMRSRGAEACAQC